MLFEALNTFQDTCAHVPDILLHTLTALNLSAALWTDDSPFSQAVSKKVIFEAPVLHFNATVDLRYLPQSVIVLVMGKPSSINSAPEFYPVPKRRVLLVTDSFDVEALPETYMKRITSYRHTRFAWFNLFPDESQIWTLSNPLNESLITIESREAINIFQDVRLSHIPDYQHREIQVLVDNFTVYSYIAPGINQSNYVDGLEGTVFNEACKLMNLNPKYNMPEPGVPFGLFENGTFGKGFQRDAMEMKTDALIGGAYFKPGSMGLVDMSNPWGFICVRYLVPRPTKLNSVRYVMVNVFSWTTWLMTVATILFLTAMSTIIARNSSNSALKNYFTVIDSFMKMIFHLLQMRHPGRSEYSGCFFPLLLSWGCLGFLLTTAYNSELAASFTSPRYSKKIQTESEFIQEGYTWGSGEKEVSWWLTFNMENPVTRAWVTEHRTYEEEGDRVRKLEKGEKYILVGLTIGKIFFYRDNDKPPDELTYGYEVGDNCITEMYEGIMFPPGSPYQQGLNLIRSRLLAAGILQKIEYDTMLGHPMIRRHIPKNVFTFSRDIRELTSYNQLTMSTIYEVFYVLLCGYVLSAIVFCFEVAVNRNKRGQKVNQMKLLESESRTSKSYRQRYYVFHLKPTIRQNILSTN